MQHPGPERTSLDRGRIGLVLAAVIAGSSLAIAALRSADRVDESGLTGLILMLYGAGVYTGVGILILWRRPGHGVGRLALVLGMAFSIAILLEAVLALFTLEGTVQPVITGWLVVVRDIAQSATMALPAVAIAFGMILLVAWFPDGHATGRRGRAVHWLLAVTVFGLVLNTAREPILRSVGWSVWWDRLFTVAAISAAAALLLALAVAVIDLGLRYRRSDSVRKAQIRWVFAAAGLCTTLTILVMISASGSIAEIPGLWDLWIASTMLPVLAIGIAVTRYHLYDIDRIVSQGIAYTIITVALFGVVAIGVVALPVVLTPQLGGDGLAVAASTLFAAILFQPLRTRVQRAVDRRFHRSRYDAERTVDGFAARLRDQLDLPTLTHDLRRTANEAVEPATTGVWLRASGEAG